MRVLSWERREAPCLNLRASYQARTIRASTTAPTASQLATFGHASATSTAPFNRGDARKIKARLPGEFRRVGDTVFSRRRQDRLAEGDRLQVVPAGEVQLTPLLQRRDQIPHGEGERIREPGLPPPGPMPLATIADRRVIHRAGDALGPAGPTDLAQRQPLGPLESPSHRKARTGPLVRRTGPDVIPTGRSRTGLILED